MDGYEIVSQDLVYFRPVTPTDLSRIILLEVPGLVMTYIALSADTVPQYLLTACST